MSSATESVLAERERQILDEGWTDDHDDQWTEGQLARAAVCYATPAGVRILPAEWPWAANWWKPKNRRRDLVRAAALLIAEIERLDRLSSSVSLGAGELPQQTSNDTGAK